MVALTARQRLNLPPAAVAAGIVGTAAALAAALFPTWRLEGLVLDLGIAALIPFAAPPLGLTARILLVLAAGFGAGGATLLAARHLLQPRRRPPVRRGDRHPDAPLREPVMAARDLGTPFLEVIAQANALPSDEERELPADLDVPMVAFASGAVAAPETEMRIETFELTPANRPEPLPLRRHPDDLAIAAPETDATIHALLDRLERGMARRRTHPAMTERPEAEGLEEALVTLRRMAVR